MTDDPSLQVQSAWPLPKFHFLVQWDDVRMTFQEVSGLEAKTEVIEYRAGNSKLSSSVKMPDLVKASNVTLKKGQCTDSAAFFEWVRDAKMNAITRKTVTISLLDETTAPTMIWTLQNAFVVKVLGLEQNEDDVAIESIELAHEGLTIANG